MFSTVLDGDKFVFGDKVADARLIAAAPDMLAALKVVLDDVMTFHDATGQGDRVLSNEAHSQLLAAIAKAEGES
ncbi:MAG: hypothetical protein E5V25_13945 [Mesorhizobium sp.]|nr:MAG: hypothetical protein E5V25_13945 [Mesorhizobium sp.]